MTGYALVPVFAANVLFGAGLFAHAFLYNFYLEAAGHGPAVMGGAAAALTAGGLAALVPAGLVVDRVGPRAGYVVAAALAAAGLSAGAFVVSPVAVYVAAFGAGLGTATWRVAMAPLLLRLARGRLRARALSWNVGLLVGSGAVWTALSGAAPGWLERTLGLDPSMALRSALLAGAAATLFAGPAVLFVRARATSTREGRGDGLQNEEPESPLGQHPRSAERESPAAVAALGSRKQPAFAPGTGALVLVVAMIAVWMTGSGLVLPFFNIFFERIHDLPVARVGLILAASQALTAVALVVGAEVAARLGPERALVAWMFVFPPALWALGLAGSFAVALPLFLLQAVVPASTNPLIDQVLLERAPEERHGTVSSARNAATEVSGLAGASAGGWLLESTSFGTLYAVAGAVAATGALGLSIWLRRVQPGARHPRGARSDTRRRRNRHNLSA